MAIKKDVTHYRHATVKNEIEKVVKGAACPCGKKSHPAGEVFYVTAIDGKRVAVLAGPYFLHENALGMVERASREAEKIDPKAVFYEYGTTGFKDSEIYEPALRPGVLNLVLRLPTKQRYVDR